MKIFRNNNIAPALIAGFLSGTALFYVYAAFFQLYPLSSRRLWGSLGILAIGSFTFFFFLVRKFIAYFDGNRCRKSGFLLFLAVFSTYFLFVMFPIPIPQMYDEHEFVIFPTPDEKGDIRPLTLSVIQLDFPTIFGTRSIDVSFSQMQQIGHWERSEAGLTTTDPSARLSWKGLAGNKATVVFAAGKDRGQAIINWDGNPIEANLYRSEPESETHNRLEVLSFDINFATLNSFFPTLAAAIILCFFVFGLLIAVRYHVSDQFPLGFFLAAAIIFVGVRIIEFIRVDEPLRMIDSSGYLGISRFPVWEILRGKAYCFPDIPGYCQSRPWVVPLIFKLFRQDLRLISIAFLTISVLSWIFGVLIAAASFSRPLVRKAAVVCLFGLGCTSIVSRWEVNILSESVSISFGILMTACWIWLFRSSRDTAHRGRVILAGGGIFFSAAILIFTRDSNVFFALIVVLSLVLIAAARRNYRKIASSLISGLFCLIAIGLGTTGDRWKFSYFNVLFMRILRDESATTFFISAGMPNPPRLTELSGVEHSQGNELFQSAAFDELRDWVSSNGMRTYARYLLRKPAAILHEPFSEGYLPVAFGNTEYRFSAPGYRPFLPEVFQDFFGLRIPFLVFLVAVLFAIRKAALSRELLELGFIFGLLLSSYLLVVIVFSLDSYDFVRQSTQIVIQKKWALWYSVLYLFDSSKKPENHKPLTTRTKENALGL